MRLPILELTLVATLFVAAWFSGDGFAETVERYDAFVHGETYDMRIRSRSQLGTFCFAKDEDLIKSWDDQFRAMQHAVTTTPQAQPVLQSLVASVAGEVL